MFSKTEKKMIAKKIEELLLSLDHPEMPHENPKFKLHVDGEQSWSWADIEPNWTFDEQNQPGVNPFNEMSREILGNYPLTPRRRKECEMEARDRAYQYAKFYATTHRLPDFQKAIEQHMGREFIVEATLAWEAIDQYEGNIRPAAEIKKSDIIDQAIQMRHGSKENV